MSFTVAGKLYKKFETQQVNERFRKREFVIEFIDGNPMYPQYLNFQLIQDKVDMIEPYQEGSELQVEFNLRGREWQSPQGEMRYFNSLDAWRIQPAAQQPPQMPPPPPPMDAGSPDGPIDVSKADDDDLPF